MHALDVARSPLIVVGRDGTVHHVARLMAMHQVDAVVVCEAGAPIGLVTERDLVVRGLARRLSGEAPVTRVMTARPVTVDGTVDAADAYRLLREQRLHRLPVMIDGQVVAMLTLDDFAVDPPAELTRLVHSTAQSES
jgi:CBS domain-containing protein